MKIMSADSATTSST